jgi:polysaccharide biosynthesis protein PelC
MTHARSRIVLPAALLALVAACAASGARYHDRNMDFGAIKTVAIVPFSNLTRESVAADRVRDVFASMLLATGAIYVVPQGEVQRVIGKAGVQTPSTPSTEEVVKLGQMLKADAIITGVLKEYGEVRSGSTSLSVQMQESSTGKVVWSASTTKGGVTLGDRLLGSSATPMNQVTEAAVDDLLNDLFK